MMANNSIDVNSAYVHMESKVVRTTMILCVCFLTFGVYWSYDLPGSMQVQFTTWFRHGYTREDNSVFYAAYSWPNIILPLVAGALMDHVTGYRVGSLVCSALVVFGQLLFCIGLQQRSFGLALFGRFVFGVGGESLTLAQDAFVGKWFSKKQSPSTFHFIFSLVLACSRLGGALNLAVSPWLANLTSTPVVGWTALMMCLLGLLCNLICCYFDYRRDRTQASHKNSMQTAAAAGALVVGSQTKHRKSNKPLATSPTTALMRQQQQSSIHAADHEKKDPCECEICGGNKCEEKAEEYEEEIREQEQPLLTPDYCCPSTTTYGSLLAHDNPPAVVVDAVDVGHVNLPAASLLNPASSPHDNSNKTTASPKTPTSSTPFTTHQNLIMPEHTTAHHPHLQQQQQLHQNRQQLQGGGEGSHMQGGGGHHRIRARRNRRRPRCQCQTRSPEMYLFQFGSFTKKAYLLMLVTMLLYTALFSLIQVSSVIMQSTGPRYTAERAGFMLMIPQLAALVMMPFWGLMSDSCHLLSTLFYACLLLLFVLLTFLGVVHDVIPPCINVLNSCFPTMVWLMSLLGLTLCMVAVSVWSLMLVFIEDSSHLHLITSAFGMQTAGLNLGLSVLPPIVAAIQDWLHKRYKVSPQTLASVPLLVFSLGGLVAAHCSWTLRKMHCRPDEHAIVLLEALPPQTFV